MATLMNWTQLMSTTRFQINEQRDIVAMPPSISHDAYRTPFHVDYDRLVFSHAFRRLGRKTQVHPLAKNDHTHNRLTHSVEVASVGRSLGRKVGGMLAANQRLPAHTQVDDFGMVVQVACLAHDVGNPPFGHTGEDALRQWFRDAAHQKYLQNLSREHINDIQTYEGNAHSLRQVASLEMYAEQGGMRLTAASIGALLKYPWTSSHPDYGRRKFNIYQAELPYIRHIAHNLGLPEKQGDCWARHPLSYLMEAADDICYALMDLEDAIDLELLDYETVSDVLAPLAKPEHRQVSNPRDKIAMMRGYAIGQAIESIAHTFIQHETDLLNGEFCEKDLLSCTPTHVQETLNNAKNLARERVFRHRSKLMYELAAFPCLGSLLDLLVPSVHEYVVSGSLNVHQSLALELLNPAEIKREDGLYLAYMKVLDYVGGMTDNYAAKTARELSGVNIL
ncbi:deoxyguanosinetriphosphate triphosphohydrolase [Wielerella bovis]|uniref:deoxyguanosinetriphosphate triphosphohydrolase n=1 Tax=Wielerella bovis TaxID=2917790 RepID=UPI00201915F6|nr:deoxyguanosinetriphosphate triphosphohydrolase [Wielerella bovis]ULJ69751.1 deoxyguanosinetriphosphate triphosphohydrolase [Wielerella bovis]